MSDELEAGGGAAAEAESSAPASMGATVDALFDKALGNALGGDDDEDEDDGPAAGAFHDEADGEPAKGAAAAKDDDDEDEESGAGDEPAAADDDADETEDEELEGAVTALRFQKVPWSVIKSTSKKELIAWGSQAADEIKARNRDLEQAARERSEPESDATKATSAAAHSAPKKLDWSVHTKAIADELGIEHSSADKAFRPVLETVVNDLTAAFEERIAKVEASANATSERTQADEGRRRIDENVRRLGKDFPALRRDGELREKLVEQARTYAAGAKARGLTVTADDCFDAVASGVLGKAKRSDITAKRRGGLSHGPERAGGFGAPAPDMDTDFTRRMELVEAGKFEQARALPPPQAKKAKANGSGYPTVRKANWY